MKRREFPFFKYLLMWLPSRSKKAFDDGGEVHRKIINCFVAAAWCSVTSSPDFFGFWFDDWARSSSSIQHHNNEPNPREGSSHRRLRRWRQYRMMFFYKLFFLEMVYWLYTVPFDIRARYSRGKRLPKNCLPELVPMAIVRCDFGDFGGGGLNKVGPRYWGRDIFDWIFLELLAQQQ